MGWKPLPHVANYFVSIAGFLFVLMGETPTNRTSFLAATVKNLETFVRLWGRYIDFDWKPQCVWTSYSAGSCVGAYRDVNMPCLKDNFGACDSKPVAIFALG